MNIELPEGFAYEPATKDGYAYVNERNILVLKNNISYSKVMYLITHFLKTDGICPYCGQPLKGRKITMDHILPQDRGGPTIPNNLVPCCSSCNEEKSNMDEWEYEKFKNLSQSKKAIYRKEIEAYIVKMKEERGHEIPSQWLTKMDLKNENIIVTINFREDWYRSNKYQKVKRMYRTYNHLTYPVIIDKHNVLLDGFYTLMFAEKNGINTDVPIIRLDNVEKVL